MQSFIDQSEFFSTTGGNPVACKVGLAVLDVLEEERLQANARRVGALLHSRLTRLCDEHPLIGDVRGERALSLARDAVERARRAAVPSDLYFALKRYHWALHDPSHLDERLGVSQELGAAADRLNDPVKSLAARMCMIQDAVERGQGDIVEREVRSFRLRAATLRQPYYTWYASLYRAMYLTMRGELDEADIEVERARALGQETGAAITEVWYGIQLFVLRRWQGRVRECEALLRELAARHPQSAWTGSLAVIAAVEGNRELARDALQHFLRDDLAAVPDDLTRLPTLAFLAETCCELEDVEAARALRPALEPYTNQHVVIGLAIAHYGSMAGYHGRLCNLVGDGERARRDLERAVAMDGEAGAGVPLATNEVALAEALLASEQRPAGEGQRRALELLLAGEQRARSLGQNALAARARRLRIGVSDLSIVPEQIG